MARCEKHSVSQRRIDTDPAAERGRDVGATAGGRPTRRRGRNGARPAAAGAELAERRYRLEARSGSDGERLAQRRVGREMEVIRRRSRGSAGMRPRPTVACQQSRTGCECHTESRLDGPRVRYRVAWKPAVAADGGSLRPAGESENVLPPNRLRRVHCRHGQARWSDLDPRLRRAMLLAGAVEAGLKIAALIDVAQRPARRVRGSKARWAAAITLVNAAGAVPIVYFLSSMAISSPASGRLRESDLSTRSRALSGAARAAKGCRRRGAYCAPGRAGGGRGRAAWLRAHGRTARRSAWPPEPCPCCVRLSA